MLLLDSFGFLLIYLSLLQAYNLLQLLYFSLEKVTEEGEGGGTNLTSDQTYPSVIHPPELDPALMTVYRYYIYIYIYIPLSISTNIILQRRHHLHQCRCDSLQSYCPGGAVSGANAFLCAKWMLLIDKYNFRTVQSFWYPGCFRSLSPSYLKLRFSFISWLKERLVSIVVSATFYTLDKTFRLTKWNRYLVISVSLQKSWNWLCKLRLLWSLDGLVSLLGKYPSFWIFNPR